VSDTRAFREEDGNGRLPLALPMVLVPAERTHMLTHDERLLFLVTHHTSTNLLEHIWMS
jgi:hypothetical protein